jgi:hypothetical protein
MAERRRGLFKVNALLSQSKFMDSYKEISCKTADNPAGIQTRHFHVQARSKINIATCPVQPRYFEWGVFA